MKRHLFGLLLAVLLPAVALAGSKIDLPQASGTVTPLQGVGESALVNDACSATRYTSTGDKNVKASAGALCGVLAATGTSVTVTVWDDADGTCSSGQVVGTLTLTNGTYYKLPIRHATGICVVVGGTSPDLTVFWK